jgi:hypothetical protein
VGGALLDLFVIYILATVYFGLLFCGAGVGLAWLLLFIVLKLLRGGTGAKKEGADFVNNVNQQAENDKIFHKALFLNG